MNKEKEISFLRSSGNIQMAFNTSGYSYIVFPQRDYFIFSQRP